MFPARPTHRATARIPRTVLAAFVMIGVLALQAGITSAGSGPLASPGAPSKSATLAPHRPGVVLVGWRPGAASAARSTARESLAVASVAELSPLARDTEEWQLPAGLSVEAAIRHLQANPNVRFAEPDYLVQAAVVSNDPYYTNGSLWGMEGDASPLQTNPYGSGAAEAWASGYTGSANVVVGVIDEGIQYTHPDLAANIWTNPGEIAANGIDDDGNGYIDDVHGWDFYNNDNSVYDAGGDSHGTHVSGTIGGAGGNGQGVAGVNWAVTIISAKFLGPSGGSTSGAVRALDYLTDLKLHHGVNIVVTSNSWGGGGFDQSLLDAINRSGDAGMLFVAAAGNAGANNDTGGFYPANYQCTNGGTRGWDCLVSVAAIDSSGAKASFSDYGATTVDLGAPGVGVYSSVPTNSYASYSGTSMATPHVSGAIALCASIGAGLTAENLRNAVVNSTTPTASLAGITVTGGRLDIGAMVGACLPSTNPVDGPPGSLSATPISSTKIGLTWTDGSTNETGFEIERAAYSAGACGAFSPLATIGADQVAYTAAGLSPSTGYCFRVRARNSFGGGNFSAWTSEAHATTLAPPPGYACSLATYGWIDATSGGTQLFLTDDSSVTVALPFAFPFYGDPYSAATVSSNGYVRFPSGSATAYSNAPIPTVGDPDGFAAPFWDDLNPGAGGSIWTRTVGSAPNRQWVAAWVGVPEFGVTGPGVTAEVVLDEASGALLYQYQNVVVGGVAYDYGASATVGVENADATAGTQVSYNTATLANGTAYRCATAVTAPSITTTSLPDGTTGSSYAQALAASGGQAPYAWLVVGGSLPTGLALDPASGAISGIPTATGSFTFTAQVAGANGATSTRSLGIRVADPLAISTASLPAGVLNVAYSQTLAATGGQTPRTWSLASGTLPTGLTLAASSGVISGKPTAIGTWNFTVRATDSGAPARTTTKALSIAVYTLPGSFNKLAPKGNASGLATTVLLQWQASSGATSYAYCLGPTNSTSCPTGWVTVGAVTSTTVSGLTRGATYYWQVRAANAAGTKLAGGGWWKFRTAP